MSNGRNTFKEYEAPEHISSNLRGGVVHAEDAGLSEGIAMQESFESSQNDSEIVDYNNEPNPLTGNPRAAPGLKQNAVDLKLEKISK